jgi:hypothetical protein
MGIFNIFRRERFLKEDEIEVAVWRSMGGILGTSLPMFALIRGALILVGGDNWAGRSLELLMTAFHNAHLLWGTILLLGGMLGLIGQWADAPRVVWSMAWVNAGWSALAASASALNAIKNSAPIDLGGVSVWGFFVVCFVLQAQSRVRHPVESSPSEENL